MSAIFISHSSSDSAVAEQFKRWLRDLGHRSVFLDFDPEDGIPAGRDWEKELYRQLQVCRAVIVLASSQSLASRWCFAEIAIARSLGKDIFPVKISATEILPILSDRQVVDFTEDEHDALDRLARGLATAGLEAGDLFDWDPRRSPYPGLPAFQEEDAGVYFGRDDEIGQGLDALHQMERYGGENLLMLLGASGTGKSSLVRAGILPRLRRDSDRWHVLGLFRPGEDPLVALSDVMAGAFRELGDDRRWNTIYDRLKDARTEDRVAAFGDLLRDLRLGRREATTVLTIDQFEEALGHPAGHPGAQFIPFLHGVLAQKSLPLLVIVTLRSDFLEAFMHLPGLSTVGARRLLLSPMSLNRLPEIIEKPAAVAGVELEPGLVQAVVQDANTEDALPLLSFTLRELYERYADDRVLEIDEYRKRLGGMQGSIAKVAEGVLASQPLADADLFALRRAFLSMVRMDEEERYARRVATWDEMPERVQPLLERFVRARLLISSGDARSRTLEIAHDALFRVWDVLKTWLSEDKEVLRLAQEVRQGARRWEANDRLEEYLWRGGRLSRALELCSEDLMNLSAREMEFLEASENEVNRVRVQRARRRRVLLVASVLVATVMSILALRERDSRRLAEQQRQFALSGKLAAQSISHLNDELDLSLLLGVEAMKRSQPVTVEARRSILSGLLGNPHLHAFLGELDSAVDQAAFSPDGSLIAVTDGYGFRLFDAHTKRAYGRPLLPDLEDLTESTWTVAFSPDGKTLATSNAAGVIRLWDVHTQEPAGRIETNYALALRGLAFSPDGSRLAAGGCATSMLGDSAEFPLCDLGEVGIWDTATLEPVGHPMQGHADAVTGVAFTPDGGTLISGSEDGTIQFWDAAALRSSGPLIATHSDGITDVDVSADGSVLASASDDRTVRLWNVATRRPIGEPITGHPTSVNAVSLDRTGILVASAGDDGDIYFWEVQSGRYLGPTLTAHANSVNGLAFSPTDDFLVSGDIDGTLILWDLTDRNSISQSTFLDQEIESIAVGSDDHIAVGGSYGFVQAWYGDEPWLMTDFGTSTAASVAISPNNAYLAAGGCGAVKDERQGPLAVCTQGLIRIWDLEERSEDGVELAGHQTRISSLAFHPTRNTLASGGEEGAVILWDLDKMEALETRIAGHTASVEAMAFHPQGRILATASYDGTVRLWDVDTGEPSGHPLPAAEGTALALAFSPDGRLLATGGGARTVMLWNMETRALDSPPIAAHTSSVFSLAFNPFGDLLASGSFDQSIRLWDIQSQEMVGEFVGHSGAVTGLAFTASGSHLFSGGRDGVLKGWDVDDSSWIELGCLVANRNLSFSEWRQYMGEREYEKTCNDNPVHASYVRWGEQLIEGGDVERGVRILRRAVELDPSLDAEAPRLVARARAVDGQNLARQGLISEAVAALDEASKLTAAHEIEAEAWNSLCWHGSLAGLAAHVMHACENSVEFAGVDEEAYYRDSRGLARALTGDRDGAAADFQAFVDWIEPIRGANDDYVRTRRAWLDALRNGTDPFDAETLEMLRNE